MLCGSMCLRGVNYFVHDRPQNSWKPSTNRSSQKCPHTQQCSESWLIFMDKQHVCWRRWPKCTAIDRLFLCQLHRSLSTLKAATKMDGERMVASKAPDETMCTHSYTHAVLGFNPESHVVGGWCRFGRATTMQTMLYSWEWSDDSKKIQLLVPVFSPRLFAFVPVDTSLWVCSFLRKTSEQNQRCREPSWSPTGVQI